MPDFTPDATVREVLESAPDGADLLWRHGFEIGPFVDVLSQYQSLRDATRSGRLRALPELLQELNRHTS